MLRIDARLPLRFGPLQTRTTDDAVLLDDDTAASAPLGRFTTGQGAHPPGCACCSPRSAAAQALATLFHERATSQGPAFRAVLAVVGPHGEAAIRAALAVDPLVSARYRLTQSATDTTR